MATLSARHGLMMISAEAKAHTATSSDVDLNKLAVAAGLATVENGRLVAPFVGPDFGLAVVTTNMDMAPDLPLAPVADQSYGPSWWIGIRRSTTAGCSRILSAKTLRK